VSSLRLASGLAESDQQGYPNEDTAGGVVLFGEPTDVAFDSVTDPGRANPIDGCRADEVAVKHENLLSVGRFRRSSHAGRLVMFPRLLGRTRLLGFTRRSAT
jgi:hypothetical protein